jgi:hypothetical protein
MLREENILPARRVLWIPLLVDLTVSYAYCFLVDAVPLDRQGPHAPWTHWVQQPWVYALLSPIVIVASWRALIELRRALAGERRHWWRLPAEGAAGGAVLYLSVMAVAVMQIFDVRAFAEAIAFGGLLGGLLTLTNDVAARAIKPYINA